MRVEEIHREQQCVSEPRRERAEDSTVIVKGLYFVESLPRLWLFWSLISSCGGKGDRFNLIFRLPFWICILDQNGSFRYILILSPHLYVQRDTIN